MMVNVREIISPPVLIFGITYTVIAIIGKIIGTGGPALLLGFNYAGAIRIGTGMIPRGEGALITCGIGLAAGAINNQHFSAAVFMIFLTIVASPAFLGLALKIPMQGTRKHVKNDDSVHEIWKFESGEIADLIMSNLLKDLRGEGFFIQTMNLDEGLSHARKGDIAISITREDKSISFATSRNDMPLVKNEIYEVIINLSQIIERLKKSTDPDEMKEELLDDEARTTKDILALLNPDCFIMDLAGTAKEEIITELVDILAQSGKLLNREKVLADVLERERTMSTGMNHGIALPHGKTDGVADTAVAIGIKKEGADFDSIDGQLSRLFILIASPKKSNGGMYMQFIAAVGSILRDDNVREAVINCATPQEAVDLMRKHHS